MELPFPDSRFDAAVMALAIFYVPEPPKGVAEMVRVVAPGGMVAAYIWDMANDGTPTAPIQIEMRAIGLTPLRPPSVDASRIESLRDLWAGAGLERIETREIVVQRTFVDFEDGVDPVKPDTQRVGKECTRGVIGSPIGNAGERCCSPPSNYRREQGRQRHLGSG